MSENSLLVNACILLGTVAVSAPLATRFGLGAVLGYLAGGVLIGPHILKWVAHPQEVMHFSEFGVVLMLFLIGLELDPRRLYQLRKPILGLGGLQVFCTSVVIALICEQIGFSWIEGIVIGLALSQSSTAMVTQMLQERKLLKSHLGRSAFAINLFQDLAMIPIIALIPLLSQQVQTHSGDESPIAKTVQVILVIASIVWFGRNLARPVFRAMAAYGSREVFTAFSLFLVIATALLMQSLGLSMALGSFLAGVVLADSEYRNQLEISIETFKSLLLGLFFISVGMSLDLHLLLNSPAYHLGSVVIFVVVKILILLPLGLVFGLVKSEAFFLAALMSNGAEVAFVIVSFATQFHAISAELGGSINLVVGLSMFTTPPLLILHDVLSRNDGRQAELEMQKGEEFSSNSVIIAGFGRFGMTVGRVLHALRIPTTVLENDPNQIAVLRRFGFRVHYGDPTRLDALVKAGAADAKMLIICVDNKESINTMVHLAKQHFPHLRIMCRARDRLHAYELIHSGVDGLERESFESALKLAQASLVQMGMGTYRAHVAVCKFRRHDLQTLHQFAGKHEDESHRIVQAQADRQLLEELLSSDDLAYAEEEDTQ